MLDSNRPTVDWYVEGVLMQPLVTTREVEQKQYTLISPGTHPPRTGPTYQHQADWQDIPAIVEDAGKSEVLAVDFETKGGDYSDDIEIVGLGLAYRSGSVYLDWSSLYPESRGYIVRLLREHPGLIAHNVYFDGGVVLRELGFHPQWKSCTYNLVASLANESPEQRWGLKHLMVSLLGWPDSNDIDLDEWLIRNRYYKGNRLLDESPDALMAKYIAGSIRPEKGEMWRAPKEILGKYCVLDAEACYLLFTEVLWPVALQFPGLITHHQECLHSIRKHIEQKIHGIPVSRPGLQERLSIVKEETSALESQFRRHPDVLAPIIEIEKDLMSELLGREPPLHKKNGERSKNHINWSSRIEEARSGRIPKYRFNLNSDPQLRYLFYDLLGNPVKQMTESLQPSTSNRALSAMGEAGKILADYNYGVKEIGFLEGYLEMTERRTTIHPSARTPGTVTGRLSFNGPNLQQVPKSKAMMSLFYARPGTVWVDLDFSALEPVVATEFSQDPNMLLIYGDGRPSNDIYIFVMAHIPGMDLKCRALGYDPHNPTPESLARVKKEMKKERGICKTVVLACQYGAGIRKIMETLEADGVLLSYEEVATIHSGYWNLFAQLKDFGKSLEYEWRRNKGYILNGLGRPMAVSEDYKKDLLNRFVQSTGHDILTSYIVIVSHELDRHGVQWKPLIMDWHDALTVEVPEIDGQRTAGILVDCLDQLNNKLQGSIRLKGVPVIGFDLAEVKEPEN